MSQQKKAHTLEFAFLCGRPSGHIAKFVSFVKLKFKILEWGGKGRF